MCVTDITFFQRVTARLVGLRCLPGGEGCGFYVVLTKALPAVWDAEGMYTLLTQMRRRSALVLLVAGVLALAGGLAALGQAPQPPATILLIRHAEKLTDGESDLSPVGFERAKVIPKLFGGVGAAPPHNFPKPDFLFATHVSKRSNRPVETITPLSESMGMPISHEIDDKDFATLAKELLSGKYAGIGFGMGIASACGGKF